MCVVTIHYDSIASHRNHHPVDRSRIEPRPAQLVGGLSSLGGLSFSAPAATSAGTLRKYGRAFPRTPRLRL